MATEPPPFTATGITRDGVTRLVQVHYDGDGRLAVRVDGWRWQFSGMIPDPQDEPAPILTE